MTISALPTPPLRSDPANFAARADAFLAALPQFAAEANATAAAMNLNATSDVSASSVAIGLGAKSFQVSAGKSFQGGMYLVIADAAAPSVNSMVCQVTSYSGTTLAVMVLYVRGSGTKAAWVMGLSAPYDRDVGFQDGTQAAPGISFEQDKDTGVRRLGPDAMALVVGGTDRAKLDAGGLDVTGAVYSGNGTIKGGISYSVRVEMGSFTAHDLGFIVNGSSRAILDGVGNFSVQGNLRVNNQQYFSSGSFGRFWGNASLAIGQALYAGLYGPTTTYNAKVVGGTWQSIGGGTATAVTMDEGNFSIAQSQAVGAADVPLTWTTSAQITSTMAAFKGRLEVDGGATVDWAAPGVVGPVLSRNGGDSYLSTYYDTSSLTIGSGISWKTGIAIYGQNHPSGNSIDFRAGNASRMKLTGDGTLLVGATTTSIGNTGGFAFIPGVGGNGGALNIGHSTSNLSGSNFISFLLNGTAIGSIVQSGSTAVTYNSTSDYRLKNKVRDSDARRFMQIRFRDFEWTDGRHDCGVIAHELQEIYPDLVSGERDAVEVREVEVSPYVPAVTEERIVSPAVEAVAAVEAAEAVEASPAEYRTVETPEVVLIDGVETTIIRRSLLEIKPAVEAKPAVAAVEGVEGKEAVIGTIVITPEQPAVTELREFPIYQQVNYIGLIGRMGTRLQLVIRQTDAQQELIEQQQVLIGTLTARLDALTERLEVLESAA